MITHVAIRFRNEIYSLPPPNRHHHIIWEIAKILNIESVDLEEQGFLDETGKFYNRQDALAHALICNQVKNIALIRAGRLFSEDLW